MTTIRSGTFTEQGTTSSVVVDKPSGAAAGDKVVVFISTEDSATVTCTTRPTGFTKVDGGTEADPVAIDTTGADMRGFAYEKVLDGGEGSTFTFTMSESLWVSWCAICTDGASGAVVSTTVRTQASVGGSGQCSVSAVTLTTDQVAVAAGSGYENGALNSCTNWTEPTGSTRMGLYRTTTDATPEIWTTASGNTRWWSITVVLDSATVVPPAPAITFQAGGHTRAGLEWTSGGDGGSAITDWDIDAATEAAPTTWLGVQATGSTLLYGAYTGLTNGTPYVFRVRGVNAIGDGAWSSTSTAATPSDVRGSFLLESGDKFLLESGDEFLLEAGSGVSETNAPAGNAAATGAAYTASTSVAPSAGHAAATGAAQTATAKVSPTVGHAAATGAAFAATAKVSPSAGHAAATGQAFDATATTGGATNANAEAATATGAAHNAAPSVAPSAGHAAATGAAGAVTAKVSPSAGHASATGSAYDATAQTGSFTNAPAELAAATGAAHNVTAKASPTVGHAAATGAAFDAATSVAPTAGHASATGQAFNASVSIAVAAGAAFVTALAFVISAKVSPTAGHAAATGAAHNATAQTGQLVAVIERISRFREPSRSRYVEPPESSWCEPTQSRGDSL